MKTDLISLKRMQYLTIATLLIVLSFATVISPALAAKVSETDVYPTPAATFHFPQNKQNESPMAVNPTDSNNVLSGANDETEEPDCIVSAGATFCPFSPTVDTGGVYTTTDGGKTWTHQILHWFSLVGLTSDGDMVLAFGPKPDSNAPNGFSYANGARAYAGSLASSPTFGPNAELLAVAHSDDKGVTWSSPVVATSRDNPVDFNDKIALWVDNNPNSPFFGNVYVSWTLFQGSGNFGESNTFSPEPIMFARSTDAGQTFGSPNQLTQAANNGAVGGRQGSTIRTGPDGIVYVIWDGAMSLQSAILGATSTDGGKSFGRPFLVTFKSDVPSPFPGARFRVNSFPMADVDQNAGTAGKVFVVWANYDFSTGHGVVKLVTSTDRGQTWSSAATIADVTGRSAFYPAVAVNPSDGSKVFVGFNAIDDKPAGTSPGAGVVFYDAFFVLSASGGTSFGSPVEVSAGSSDPDASSTNSLRGQFIGDYNGASASSVAAWFSWTDSRNGATCSTVDSFRAGTTGRPNIYSTCPANFGNTDIFVAKIPW